MKAAGLINNIGVSVYTGYQIDRILEIFLPDIVQVPLSILDQRLLHSGHLAKLHGSGVSIHARSVFLQGLFHMDLKDLPKYFNPIKHLLSELHTQANKQQLSINQAALSFIRDQPTVDKILIGVESYTQLAEAITDFQVEGSFSVNNEGCFNEEYVNPAKWDVKVEN
jgi:aryl-alcohol dehydrogenase-like predicted oxidoreductase